ncbi:toluene tolerance protein [Pseudomonas sp.]|uniref:toluene tolerance protein n=1 Tax=Pseudomonas sp. TaxID=306 RepID=UPI00272FED28|nr:toluene tolerance protein [Pseudomonas sp.]MDP2242727.1 toluene tolerance protein [Pseudomonas sp.]
MQSYQLPQATLSTLIEGAQLLEEDSHGPKVYRLRDGDFLKIFRRKRLLSSTLWCPYSKSFCKNALRLQQLGIPTLSPIAHYQLEQPGLTAVHYQALPGETLGQLSKSPDFNWQHLLPHLTGLIHRLHESGVYFRSLHLGNIVLTPENELGLIDISDMRFFRRPLSKWMRRRNLDHFNRYLEREGLTDSFPMSSLKKALLDS